MATAQKAIWFQTSKEQLDAVLLDVCGELQLAPTRYRLAVERYGAVNQLLERQSHRGPCAERTADRGK